MLLSPGLVFGLLGHQHRLFVGEVVQHRQETDEISGASDAFGGIGVSTAFQW